MNTASFPLTSNPSPRVSELRRPHVGSSGQARRDAPLPVNRLWLTRLFAAYSERLVRKHFHTVRLLGAPDLSAFAGRALVIYANHPSWWDPLIGLVAWRRMFADRVPYAPIDAVAVEKYAFFKKLGFFGVERNSVRGARNFLRISRELLRRPETLMLVTPQGRLADVREPELRFDAGLGHLFRHAPGAVFLPLAIEYTFWEEKHPEALLGVGEPLIADASATAPGAEEGHRELVQRLAVTSQRLAAASIHRETKAFQTLIGGRAGTSPMYDAWRWLKARVRGETFNPAHGDK